MVLLQTTFNFGDTISYLVDLGVYDFFLPFLLVFAIIFAILEKVKIFGDKSNVNAVVAVVVGLLLIVQQDIVSIINNFLPKISLVIVVILMGLLLIAMIAGKEYKGLQGTALGIGMIVVVVAVILALTSSQTSSSSWLSPADREALLRIGIPLLILLGVVWFVVSKPPKAGETKKNVFEKLAESLRDTD